jgi:hypothetical protein
MKLKLCYRYEPLKMFVCRCETLYDGEILCANSESWKHAKQMVLEMVKAREEDKRLMDTQPANEVVEV